MKKNVLELTGSFMSGGSERQAVQLSKLIHDEGSFRVFVGCLDRNGELRRDVERLGLREIPEFKLTSFYDTNFLHQVKRCADFIKANDISVVHTHDFYTNIFGVVSAAVARVPARVASKRETLSKSGKQFFVERQAFRLAHKIVANAEAVKEFLVERSVPRHKIVTVYNGLDPQRVKANGSKTREEILRELSLPTTPELHFVTMIANLRSDVKDHRMFLRAARSVCEQFTGVRFLLAGEGELTDSLKRFAAELGIEENVFFLGCSKNVGQLLSITDICALSSRSEGFSNVILEYMSASKPVVATCVGGAREAIVDGVTGFLVESGDDESMANRLMELLQDPQMATAMGAAGGQIVEKKFTLSAQLEKTLAVYERLLAEKAGDRS